VAILSVASASVSNVSAEYISAIICGLPLAVERNLLAVPAPVLMAYLMEYSRIELRVMLHTDYNISPQYACGQGNMSKLGTRYHI
jgi:hypothetical protein